MDNKLDKNFDKIFCQNYWAKNHFSYFNQKKILSLYSYSFSVIEERF